MVDYSSSLVIMFTPGETAAAGYTEFLTKRAITGQSAQAIGGAAVVIERTTCDFVFGLPWTNIFWIGILEDLHRITISLWRTSSS